MCLAGHVARTERCVLHTKFSLELLTEGSFLEFVSKLEEGYIPGSAKRQLSSKRQLAIADLFTGDKYE